MTSYVSRAGTVAVPVVCGTQGQPPGASHRATDVHKAIDFIHRYRVRTGRRPRSVAACSPVIGYQT